MLLRVARRIVPTDTPTIEVAFALAGDAYVARIRSSAGREPMATLTLPRAVVDRAVLDAAQARLEVRLDGTVAAYLDSDSRTLSSARLSELIAAAVAADALAAEEREVIQVDDEAGHARQLTRGRRKLRDLRGIWSPSPPIEGKDFFFVAHCSFPLSPYSVSARRKHLAISFWAYFGFTPSRSAISITVQPSK